MIKHLKTWRLKGATPAAVIRQIKSQDKAEQGRALEESIGGQGRGLPVMDPLIQKFLDPPLIQIFCYVYFKMVTRFKRTNLVVPSPSIIILIIE